MADRAELIEGCIMDLRRFALVLTRDRELADDLVQDTVERALSRWYLRRRDRPVRPWMFAILHNLYISGRRRHTRSLQIFDPDAEAIGTTGHGPESSLELKQVLAMLDALPEEQKIVIQLVGVEGFTYAEAANIMEIPLGTVMSRLSRGRERLRQITGAAPPGKLRSVK